MEEFIESCGLTRTESKVYLTLLDIGSSLAGRVAQKSGIHRRSVYDALERLIEKGLVSYITENNRKYFEAVHPKQLLDLIKDKEVGLNTLLPQLELKYKMSSKHYETNFFRGKHGLKSVFEDQIRVGKEILILGAATYPEKTIAYYFSRFDRRRIQKKIPLKILFFQESIGIIKPLKNSQVKFLPKSSPSDTTTYVYGDKVAIVLWGPSPFAILIHQPEIALSFSSYFQLLWSISN